MRFQRSVYDSSSGLKVEGERENERERERERRRGAGSGEPRERGANGGGPSRGGEPGLGLVGAWASGRRDGGQPPHSPLLSRP
ncbi:hypothetical protein M758_UG228300 [Ceratodon purpureus]|nr:hypothetical protein M758_UG228300 [Ceratodon purpureus]